MNYTNPVILSALGFSLLSILCLGILYARAQKSANVAQVQSGKKIALWPLAVFIMLWLLGTGLLSILGFFREFSSFPPRIMITLLPMFLFIVLFCTKNKSARTLLQHSPIAFLLAFQVFRIPVELLLWHGYLIDLLPIQMTFEGANFDILVGISGPVMALFFSQKLRLLFWWNIAGLGLLFTIVSIAMLSAPSPYRVFTEGIPNTFVAEFPFVYLPAVLVQLAFLFHVLCLIKIHDLQKQRKQGK